MTDNPTPQRYRKRPEPAIAAEEPDETRLPLIARAIARVQLNGGDPDQPAIRWNGAEMEPQEFPVWHDYLDEARAVLRVFK